MNKRTIGTWAGMLVLLPLGIGSSFAQSGYWLKDAPVSRMTKQDFEIANPVIRQALDEGKNGQSYKWDNPATKASGSVTPKSEPFARDDKTCRRAEFMISAGGRKNVSSWTLCKMPEGWKAVD